MSSYEPPTRYFFSSPDGDIDVDKIHLRWPLRPPENRPDLGDYFEAIKNFILKENGKTLIEIISKRLNKRISLQDINEILIRSEKCGAFYHLASVEVLVCDLRVKFAVSTAISETGKQWMNHEFDTLNLLNNTFKLSYLPRAYLKDEIIYQVGCKTKSMTMFLGEWFEDYHEWHLSTDEKGQKIVIWDLKNGYRLASKEEGFEIYKQASKILTLYYDTRDFSQIYSWHHAAGDFVVKIMNGVVDVKLTTARKYEPVIVFLTEDATNPLVAITYFFLNLTIKMRLDKFDGVGNVAWAGAFCLRAVTEGFFEALRKKEEEGSYRLGRLEDLHLLFKSFSQDELKSLFYSLLDLHRMHDPGDFSVIKANLDHHVDQLYLTVQNFHL